MTDMEKRLQTELQDLVQQMRARVTHEGAEGTAPAMTVEMYQKMDARINHLQDELTAVQKAALRSRNGGENTDGDADKRLERAAFVQALRKGEDRLSGEHRVAFDRLQKRLSVDSDPDGGFVVTPEFSARVSTVIYETSPVRQVATVETISTDALEGLFDGDQATVGWVSEQATRPETAAPQIGLWRIPTHEMYANPFATQKLLDDAFLDMEAWLAMKVSDRLSRLENAAFVNGTGVGQPRGFLTYPSGTNRGQLQRVNTGANTGLLVTGNGIINIVYALKSAYRQGAVWAMNRNTVGAIRRIRDDSGGAGVGNFLWNPGFGTQPQSLAGFPIVEMEDMPDLSASGSGSLSYAFGNFAAAYTIVDRQGVRILRDPYSSKPFVSFYTTKRVGGDVINFEAIKLGVVAS
jgi:HK97 family phage major capsid protein